MALKEVIPNGEAGEIAVLRAFEPKADPSPPSGMLRSFGTTNKVKIEVLRAKSFPQDDKPKQTQANPSKPKHPRRGGNPGLGSVFFIC
jgi:hypothetical protein